MSADLHQSDHISRVPASLPVPPGPWQSDVWLIERPLKFVAGGTSVCVVAGCDRLAGTAEGDKPRPSDVMCVGHRRRLRKQGGGMASIEGFIAQQAHAKPFRLSGRASSHKPFYQPIDFTTVDPQLAEGLRYIAGTRIQRGTGPTANTS